MILSDVTIKELIGSGHITILPDFDFGDLRPVGIRLHLGKDILIPEPDQTIDLSGNLEVKYQQVTMGEEGYLLKPGEFILGSTHEKFQVPRNIVCHIDGRSTTARLGLSIHCTATIVDGNFDELRSVVLEMKNIGPSNLLLKPELPIAMLTFAGLSSEIAQNSQEQYRGQEGVVAPNLKVQKQ